MGKTKWFSSPRMVWNHVLSSDMGCKMCLRPSTFVFWHLYGLWFACIGAGKSSCVIIFEDNTKILDSCQCYWRSLSVNLLWLPPDKKTLDFFFFFISALIFSRYNWRKSFWFFFFVLRWKKSVNFTVMRDNPVKTEKYPAEFSFLR